MKTPLQVKLQILTCTDCPLHAQCRTPVPLEVGSSGTNKFVVVGEAPGRVEDYKGRPFVGPAGMLLRRELRVAGLNPDTGTYMNAVCCWPNRQPPTPTTAEVETCKGNLIDQLVLHDVRIVLLAGNTALKAILPRAQMMYTMGRGFFVHDRWFYSSYHPAYIARNGSSLPIYRSQLATFARLVTQELHVDQLNWTTCLYCNARALVEYGEQVCRKHRNLWERDLKMWKRKPGIQERLF